MRQFFRSFALIVLLDLLVACAQPTTAPATQTSRVIMVVVTATPEPSATPTIKPTATLTRTPEPT